MAYVLIGIILLVIIVPIIAVLPSARQKERMQMRIAARNAGVTVELTTIADPNPKQDKYIAHTGKRIPANLKVVAYRLQRKRASDWRTQPEINWCMDKDLTGEWHWQQAPSVQMNQDLLVWLNESIPLLPQDVVQVEENQYTISVYWHEREKGEEDAVLAFLKNCASQSLFIPDLIDPAL